MTEHTQKKPTLREDRQSLV